jgi:hypothetical protein
MPTQNEPVASFATYLEAEQAINSLAERGFPVEQVTIVAGDLRFVEHVTGRRGAGQAALEAAGAGAVTGALVGFVLGMLTPLAPLRAGAALALWGLVLGAIVGAGVGLLGYALETPREFKSIRALEARRYDLVAPPEHAAEARRVLGDVPRRAAA